MNTIPLKMKRPAVAKPEPSVMTTIPFVDLKSERDYDRLCGVHLKQETRDRRMINMAYHQEFIRRMNNTPPSDDPMRTQCTIWGRLLEEKTAKLKAYAKERAAKKSEASTSHP
jgi:hypothetical protein